MKIKWKDKELILINVKEISSTEDMFKNSVHLEIEIDESDSEIKDITHFIEEWNYNKNVNDVVLLHNNKYYYLKQCYPTTIMIYKKRIESCSFFCSKVENITRKYKIKKILE